MAADAIATRKPSGLSHSFVKLGITPELCKFSVFLSACSERLSHFESVFGHPQRQIFESIKHLLHLRHDGYVISCYFHGGHSSDANRLDAADVWDTVLYVIAILRDICKMLIAFVRSLIDGDFARFWNAKSESDKVRICYSATGMTSVNDFRVRSCLNRSPFVAASHRRTRMPW